MKKNWKNWIAGGVVLTLLAGTLAVPALASVGQKAAILDYNNIKVTLDGQPLTLHDAHGNTVETFAIDGTTYLPVAALSQALGLKVSWDNNTKTVVLTSDGGAGQNQGTTVQTPPTGTTTGSYIGEAKAKEIALNHAGKTASSVTFVRAILDYDDGRPEYDVEFWSGNTEYDYEIDAYSGAILSYDADIEWWQSGTVQSSGDIGAEKAKTIALNHAGVTAADAVFLHAKLDYDDGRRVYEVEFYSGTREFDYEIDAASGEILSYDFDAERYAPVTSGGNTGSYIGEAKAKQIVEQRAGTTGTYREFKLERDDGRMVYEGELRSGWTEYEFTIDALTGTVLEWEVDR